MGRQLLLKDKVIVITGASSGIGMKVAHDVAKQGAIPVLLARSTEKLKGISEAITETTGVASMYYTLDVSSSHDVMETFKSIFEEFKRVDVLINNAGFGIFESLHKANLEEIKLMFEVNVLGLIACTKAVLPEMMTRNEGHIINIASQAGKLATPKSSGYSATKHAVLGFSNSLRMELIDTNIYVSTVNPGPIKTQFFEIADQSGNYVKNIEKFMLDPDYVSKKIVKLIHRPKRELNLPYWMNIGSTIYQLFPTIFEKIAGKQLNKK
ncbi:SDR family NAD(P)-dependent oxidoreductase [Anaerobacillus sp. MEB173]|uniref:SDR family NAD(P)-dependent oxidoreductase n=1 Tax=Anaerobacillus sp. MEB173 TaxID=3383345 RepID=UPI003F8F90A0